MAMVSEKASEQSMKDLNQLLADYEEMFGELPPIPKCGSYSTIAELMEDALISKKPVTWDEAMEAFENVKCDLV